ncbi:uncharacterized protein LOC143919033 isoform X2 [Arctopsyche grandis]|uniref:uncharacterized protein LOC143919033 isoform X2 n=1 Tax=Arctopsyche grandis TaxID=121162 RepID=UPI00406DA3F2
MDPNSKKTMSGKSTRPARNKRFTRKSSGIGQKTVKRLFTPEIKRFLKEWLVRRRENPYPNRDEKKRLAIETGLTYIQICNWFANWRRKLKNASSERAKKTWAHLIKTYNTTARGNVEQFSICSEDSIWEETEPGSPESIDEHLKPDHCYTSRCPKTESTFIKRFKSEMAASLKPQCYHVSSTTEECKHAMSAHSINKYKSHIMEKYLNGLKTKELNDIVVSKLPDVNQQPVLLSKWLESAAKFQPRQSNYVTWLPNRTKNSKFDNNEILCRNKTSEYTLQDCCNDSKIDDPYDKAFDFRNQGVGFVHAREEVEAAVALTRLAGLFKS